ncbi:MAG TPA: pilus assembly protein [Mesorhizobium sp.]|jgi:Flp pilus assembly protein TadG|nr:pilus assembly protein [Mesorhizobium sp.]
MLKRFIDCRRGTYAIATAVLCPVLITALGFAVDLATLTGARSKLHETLDGATLAASRLKDSDSGRETVFKAFLEAHLADDPIIKSYASALSVEKGLNFIETTGKLTAQVRLHFMPTFGVLDEGLQVSSTAHEATDNLEVAMVLDNTGSMGAEGMKNLREAARTMTEILEEAGGRRPIKAALVPFVTAVNVKGKGYKASWIDLDGKAPLNGVNFEPKTHHMALFNKFKTAWGVEWKGCVEARPASHNLDDTSPDIAVPASLFVPYLAPDNPGSAAQSPNSGTAWNNSWLKDSASDKAAQRKVDRYLSSSTARFIEEGHRTRTTGPNYACPTPIEPLTDDWKGLKAAIASMIHWEGSGTNVSEGLAWGMRVLSPQEPYTQGAPFNNASTAKAVVVFTDGENNVFGASSQGFNTSDYGAYGFLDEGRTGTTHRATALGNVNKWTQTMCTRLKNEGVQVFTVLLGADTPANRDLYSKCASTPEQYYPTKDMTQLRPIFEKIARRVAKLHVKK